MQAPCSFYDVAPAGLTSIRRIVMAKSRSRARSAAHENGDWVPLASFVVEFQGHHADAAVRTVVHHVEADEDVAWPGIQAVPVAEWMLARAPAPRP
jgi:hypothetical protein